MVDAFFTLSVLAGITVSVWAGIYLARSGRK